MMCSGNCGFTAEGVTLSGVLLDEDRTRTELWRRPFCGGRRCKRNIRQSLRQKDKENYFFSLYVFDDLRYAQIVFFYY